MSEWASHHMNWTFQNGGKWLGAVALLGNGYQEIKYVEADCLVRVEIFTEVYKLTLPTFKVMEIDLSGSFSPIISQKVTKDQVKAALDQLTTRRLILLPHYFIRGLCRTC